MTSCGAVCGSCPFASCFLFIWYETTRQLKKRKLLSCDATAETRQSQEGLKKKQRLKITEQREANLNPSALPCRVLMSVSERLVPLSSAQQANARHMTHVCKLTHHRKSSERNKEYNQMLTAHTRNHHHHIIEICSLINYYYSSKWTMKSCN